MIKGIEKSEIYYVTTDDEDYNEYIRYSSSSWMVRIGESEEPIYDCDELEKEFQKMQMDERLESINVESNQPWVALLNPQKQ